MLNQRVRQLFAVFLGVFKPVSFTPINCNLAEGLSPIIVPLLFHIVILNRILKEALINSRLTAGHGSRGTARLEAFPSAGHTQTFEAHNIIRTVSCIPGYIEHLFLLLNPSYKQRTCLVYAKNAFH